VRTLQERAEARRRQRFGNTRFSEEEIRAIRRAVEEKVATHAELAAKYDVGLRTIGAIATRRSFAWVPDQVQVRGVGEGEQSLEARMSGKTDEEITQEAAASAERLLARLNGEAEQRVPKGASQAVLDLAREWSGH